MHTNKLMQRKTGNSPAVFLTACPICKTWTLHSTCRLTTKFMHANKLTQRKTGNSPAVFLTACPICKTWTLLSTCRLTTTRIILSTRLILPFGNPFPYEMVTCRFPGVLQTTDFTSPSKIP